jgi:hypothetical protein
VNPADRDRLEADAEMAASAERMGYDKCVQVSCITMIVPERNLDGYCRFHRRKRAETRNLSQASGKMTA